MLAKFSGGDYAGALCALDDDGFVARARIDPILGARVAEGVSRTHFDALVSKARQTAVVQYFVPCVVSFLFLFPLLDDACDRLSPLFSPCESRRLALAPSCAPRRVSLPLRPLTDRVFPPSLPSCITPSVCPLSSLRLILTSFLSAPARAHRAPHPSPPPHSYSTVQLSVVAAKFQRSVAEMEEDLAVLITDGRLVARIDTTLGIVAKRPADVRAETYATVIAMGDRYLRDTKALALRISLTRHDVVIKKERKEKAAAHLGMRDR